MTPWPTMRATETDMRISVAVITYNWPEALELVLQALAAQVELPCEVIVTDDGSQSATRELLLRLARYYRSEEHTSELQSLMRISYAVFCLKKKNKTTRTKTQNTTKQNEITTK